MQDGSRINRMKEKWKDGSPAFGLWATMPDPFCAELVSSLELDYICVDGQHGVTDYRSMVSVFQAIRHSGVTPLVRVVYNEPWQIMKALDGGALGVVVPLVNNGEEAARAVAACRYPPAGMRSYGPIRASHVIGARDPRGLTDETLCIVMVETREGLDRVEEIAATPGVDGIYVGPSDLALSLDLPPSLQVTESEHKEAVDRIREACEKHGVAAGIQCPDGRSAVKMAGEGFTMVTLGSDAALLRVAVQREVEDARGKPSSAAQTGSEAQGYS